MASTCFNPVCIGCMGCRGYPKLLTSYGLRKVGSSKNFFRTRGHIGSWKANESHGAATQSRWPQEGWRTITPVRANAKLCSVMFCVHLNFVFESLLRLVLQSCSLNFWNCDSALMLPIRFLMCFWDGKNCSHKSPWMLLKILHIENWSVMLLNADLFLPHISPLTFPI